MSPWLPLLVARITPSLANRRWTYACLSFRRERRRRALAHHLAPGASGRPCGGVASTRCCRFVRARKDMKDVKDIYEGPSDDPNLSSLRCLLAGRALAEMAN